MPLKEARKQAGFTVLEASKQLGITPNYLRLIENGKRKPSERLYIRMTDLYRR